MEADGFSLDDKREPKLENDIPDILEKWAKRNPKKDTERNGKAFFVPKSEIVENKYDLSINRYKAVDHLESSHDSPTIILDELEKLESEIRLEISALRELCL
jgi:type I restriction enzyme M protein